MHFIAFGRIKTIREEVRVTCEKIISKGISLDPKLFLYPEEIVTNKL